MCVCLGLLGRTSLAMIAIICAVAIRLVICVMCVVCEGCPSDFASLYTCIPAFVAGRRKPFADVVVCTFVYEKHATAYALYYN